MKPLPKTRMRVIVPPIKSQGIKTKLVPWILSQLPTERERWIEPFMGTGVVGFNAGFPITIMADVNPHLVAFYEGIQNGSITPAIVRTYLDNEGADLATAPNEGYDHYRYIRSRFNGNGGGSPLDFLFLNRAGFNGMIRFSKKGWNIPFCKKPKRFIGALTTKIVNQVAAVKNIITPQWRFSTCDFRQTIGNAQAGDIIYCDPPYHGRHTDYFTTWKEEDEAELARLLKASPANFILSTWHHNQHRSNETLGKYWGDFHVITREHFYHLGAKETNRLPMVEALVMNFKPRACEPAVAEIDEGERPLNVTESTADQTIEQTSLAF